MEEPFNFCDSAPASFSFCLKPDCLSAGECLRGLAARDLTAEREVLTVVNPLLADAAGRASCPFFCRAEKVRLAYGFAGALGQLGRGAARDVRSEICGCVCQRDYYYLLRGKKPVFPSMQERIADIFSRHGLTAPLEFDRYEWAYVWGKD